MIYLVTKKQELFEDPDYTIITAERAMEVMQDWKLVQYDSETTGRDPHLCKLLCAQFGNDATDTRIVLDCESYSITLFKTILESKLIVGHNLKFDLQFLFNQGIIPRKIYDTMIVEQFLYLGFPNIIKKKTLLIIVKNFLRVLDMFISQKEIIIYFLLVYLLWLKED